MHGQISMAIQPSLGSIPNNKRGANGHEYTGVFFVQQAVEPPICMFFSTYSTRRDLDG